jgi:NAD(P)H dehydrogenase (quinone)
MMIVVTGATGAFGRLAVQQLLKRGVPADQIVAAVRTPQNASDLAALGVEVREADYDRPETLEPAFAGADKLLFVSANGPDEIRLVEHRNVVAAAKSAGVGLVAYTSLVDATTSPLGLAGVHRGTEEALAESGLPTVLLRNGWYAENYTGALAGAVERGALVASAGDGRIAAAARADYAEAAAIVLTSDEPQAGKVYELTGDTAWTLGDLAAVASDVSGTAVAYQSLPGEQYAEILTSVGLPAFLVELLVDADLKVADGALERTTDDLSTLLGRPTTSLRESVSEALSA